MTILCVGGEADCFEFVGGQAFAFDSTAGHFVSTASRHAMSVQQGVSEITLSLPSNQTEIWMHARLYQAGVGASDLIYFKTLAGAYAFKIALESDGRWSIYKYSSASWGSALATSSVPVLVNAGANIDVHLKLNASGTFIVYKNNSAVVAFAGDTTGDESNFGLIHFYGQTSGSNLLAVSQVIVTDTVDTRGLVLATLVANGAGTNSDWFGAYTAIDDTTYDESDFIYDSVTGDVDTFTHTAIDAAYVTASVLALAVAMRAKIDFSSAIGHLEAALYVSAANWFSADLGLTNSSTVGSVQNVWENDPSTSSAWADQTAVNNAEIGLKSTA